MCGDYPRFCSCAKGAKGAKGAKENVSFCVGSLGNVGVGECCAGRGVVGEGRPFLVGVGKCMLCAGVGSVVGIEID